jgi:predicted Holliday junction resolvase-like endonuclease
MEKTTNNRKSNAVYIIVIVLLLAAVGVMVYVYRHQYQKLETINVQIEAQRDTLGNQLNNMILSYDSVRTQNQKIKADLDHEKKKIRALIRKMYSAEQVSLETIRAYEKETATLRAIMRNYIHQIDSLNTLSQRLIAENKEVKQTLQTYKEENKELAEHKNVLEAKVKKASVLKITGLVGGALNSADKEIRSASRAKKLKSCFVINENNIVEAGLRTIYVRFITPDKNLMLTDNSGEAELGGELQKYSSKREVDFQGEALETCVYFVVPDGMKLSSGQYEMQIYIDGGLAGSAGFILKGGFLF